VQPKNDGGQKVPTLSAFSSVFIDGCVAFRADDAVRYALDLYRLHHSHPLTTVHSRKSCSEDLIGRFPETKHFFLVVDSVPALCSTRGLLGLNIENAETRDSIARWRPPAA
jgi:hypothetical protein